MSKYNKDYYLKNKERKKQYVLDNKLKIQAYQKEYHKDNEEVKKQRKSYYINNIDKFK